MTPRLLLPLAAAHAALVRRSFILTSMAIVLVGVGGCAPMGQFRSTYQYMPAKSVEGRACTAQCTQPDGPAKETCWVRCGGKVIQQKDCVAGCSEARIAPVETPNIRED